MDHPHEFEARLRQKRPVETSVTPGVILFEAGLHEGIRRQLERSRRQVRRWKALAVAASLLASAVFTMHHWSEPANQSLTVRTDSPVAQSPDTTDLNSDPPQQAVPAADLEVVAQSARPPWGWAWGSANSPLIRRNRLLLSGVAGLPEPHETYHDQMPTTQLALMRKLLP